MRIGVLLVILLSTACWGQDSNDGNNLLQRCNEAVRQAETNFRNTTLDAEWCLGYVGGFVDSLDAVEMYESADFEEYKSNRRALICFPEDSTIGQDIRIVVKFLQDHPEKLHYRERNLVFMALQQAFPCPVAPAKKSPPAKK